MQISKAILKTLVSNNIVCACPTSADDVVIISNVKKGLDEHALIMPKRNVTFITQRNAKFSFLMINVATKDYEKLEIKL
jgi:hypothetical protein